MRAEFGPTLSFIKGSLPPPDSPPSHAAPPGMLDVEISAEVSGNDLIATWPPTDPSTHNKLMEVRAYPFPSGSPVPSDARSLYEDGSAVFASQDVSSSDQSAGGTATIGLPTSLPDGNYVVATLRVFAN